MDEKSCENDIGDNKSDENNQENAKRIKTDNLADSEKASTSSTVGSEKCGEPSETSFPKCNIKNRNYRKKSNEGETKNDSEMSQGDAQNAQVQSMNIDTDVNSVEIESTNRTTNESMDQNESNNINNESNIESNDENSNFSNDTENLNSDSDSETEEPLVLSKEKPKHKWFMVEEVIKRELGSSCRYKQPDIFQRRCYGSLHCVQRLELMYKMDEHEGCVNSLNFHPNGELLASGSDDLTCIIWDWPLGKKLYKFETKHRANVFQTKFLPLSGDLHIVTCARDGHVRLHQVSRTEGLRSSRKLGSHKGPVHKLSTLNEQPHIVLSAGEDGCVFHHDVRVPKVTKLITVKTLADDCKIPLYSIHSHPLKSHEFCVSGRDNLVRVYDQRKLHTVMATFYPGNIRKKSEMSSLHVTCAVYNHNGTEILASYNDDDIFLFDSTKSTSTYLHRYQGHRNGATIKGVNFFGPKSEFVVSGSDCGNLYFWDKNSEAIVQWMLADDNGVVNCLEPHPVLPIIATSGIDCDVKLWVPSNEQEPKMEGLSECVRKNLRTRAAERNCNDGDINDAQMLWMLWRQLRTAERIQRSFRDQLLDTMDTEESNSLWDALESDEVSTSSSDSDSSHGSENEYLNINCSQS